MYVGMYVRTYVYIYTHIHMYIYTLYFASRVLEFAFLIKVIMSLKSLITCKTFLSTFLSTNQQNIKQNFYSLEFYLYVTLFSLLKLQMPFATFSLIPL